MTRENEALLLDLVEWIARAPQPYDAVMAAWRTSCPRLSIWEDAVDGGYVAREWRDGVAMVRVTPEGREFLTANERLPEPV